MSRLPVGRRPQGLRARSSARRLSLEPLESKTLLATFTVTSNADPADITEGTLRWAIVESNNNPGVDSIEFNLPGNQRTIGLTRALPPITRAVTIDGTTQTGYDPNVREPQVEVSFVADTGSADGFRINSGATTIRGLSITNFPGNGITITNADENRIENNWIGVTRTGADGGNEGHGVLIQSSSRNRIGGDPTRGNRISFNGETSAFNGVTIEILGSGRAAIENRITHNTISRNGGLGIDLGNDGVTPNDAAPDADTGPNNLQNYPEILLAATIDPVDAQARTEIQARLQSQPNTTFQVQFFENESPDRSGFGEGEILLLTRQVSTDATGVAVFTTTLFDTVEPGRYITATATDSRGNTSEFSGAAEVQFITSRVDLAVTASANPNPVNAGQPLTYLARVSNLNFDPEVFSNSAILEVVLPENVFLNENSIFTSVAGAPVQVTQNVIRVDFGRLAGRQSETLIFSVVPSEPGLVQANFSVTGGIADPNPQNNQATVITQANLGPQTPVLNFRVREFSVGESGGEAVIEVERTNWLEGVARVNYRTVDGTATAGTHYVQTSGTLVFQSNEALKTFTIPIIDNDQLDPNRTVIVELTNPGGGAIIGNLQRATLTIFDDDPPTPGPQFIRFVQSEVQVLENAGQISIAVRRVGDLRGVVSIPYSTSPGTARPGNDYSPVSGTLVFGDGQVESTIVVPIIDNAIRDGQRTFRVDLGGGIGAAPGSPSSVEVTIIDDESPLSGAFGFSSASYTVSEADGVATITVTRAGGFGTATVRYATVPGTAQPEVRYLSTSGFLTFAPGETEKTFTVELINTPEFFEPQDLVLTLEIPSGGEFGENAQATLTIIDSEPAPATSLQFSTHRMTVDESIGMATLTIERMGPPIGTVSIRVFTNAGDAVPGVHYEPIDTRITFGPGETSKTVSIRIIDNDVFDADRALGVFLADAEGNALLGPIDSHVLIIRNTDPDPIVPFVADVIAAGPGTAVSTLTLLFNKPMDPATLLLPSNYNVVALGRDGIFGTPDDRQILISGLELLPDGTGVTIVLATPIPGGEFVALGVNGLNGGLMDLSGNLIDGNRDGLAGGHFSTAIGRAVRMVYRDHDGDMIGYTVTGGGFVEVVRGAPGTGDVVRVIDAVPGRSILQGRVVRQRGGDGLALIRRIEGIDPFGRVRSALRTPPFVDLSQLTPAAVDALIASRGRPARR